MVPVSGCVTIEAKSLRCYAHKKYRDTQPRVINEIVSLYGFKSWRGIQRSHVLYDILLKFITQKNGVIMMTMKIEQKNLLGMEENCTFLVAPI